MLGEVEFAEFQKENFSLLIDARSPREFLHSHLIGALNFYALNDEEYQEIGTIYKKNQTLAKARGASYICQNTAKYIIRNHLKFSHRRKGGFKAYKTFVTRYFENEINFDFLLFAVIQVVEKQSF